MNGKLPFGISGSERTVAMIGMFAVASIASGTLMASTPDRLSMARERAELFGGLLLVAGLLLIGFGLSPFLR